MAEKNYDFCPKCGALALNGECPSCGKSSRKSNKLTNNNAYSDKWDKEHGAKKNLLVPFLAIGFAFLTIGICTSYICNSVSDFKTSFYHDDEVAIEEDDIMDFFEKELEEKNLDENEDVYANEDIDEDHVVWSEESILNNPHTNYTKEEIGNGYYEFLADCFDDSYEYSFERVTFEQESTHSNFVSEANYIQLTGDIPNLASLNEQIKIYSTYQAQNFSDGMDKIEKEYFNDEYYSGITFYYSSDAFVTYNDEKTVSIVCEQRYKGVYSGFVHLEGINIDLETGMIVENTDILNVDDEFIKDFIKKCEKQNGPTDGDLANYSVDDFKEKLTDPVDLILYYTPIGMEIGFSYEEEGGAYGWITVTYSDYEQFLNSF